MVTKFLIFPIVTLLLMLCISIKFFNISVEIGELGAPRVFSNTRGASKAEEEASATTPAQTSSSVHIEVLDGAIARPTEPSGDKKLVQQASPYAYVTLIAGIDKSYKYRGFLYNTLIMKRSLVKEGSTADFIALIGYSEDDTSLFESDIAMLSHHGIIVHVLPRLLSPTQPFGFAEMALLKITPWLVILM